MTDGILYCCAYITRSSAVAEGPRDVHVIVVMSSLNMCEMATNCVAVYAKSRFSGIRGRRALTRDRPHCPLTSPF